MVTARLVGVAPCPCDRRLLDDIAHVGDSEADDGPLRRIALLGPSGEPYRVLVLRGLRECECAWRLLRRLGFCPALPMGGYDEVYRQLWPPVSEERAQAAADGA